MKFNKDFVKAFKNTKVFDFAFGKSLVCPTCGRTITDPTDIEFLEMNGECLGCDTVRGDTTCDNPEEFYTGLDDYEEKLRYV